MGPPAHVQRMVRREAACLESIDAVDRAHGGLDVQLADVLCLIEIATIQIPHLPVLLQQRDEEVGGHHNVTSDFFLLQSVMEKLKQ